MGEMAVSASRSTSDERQMLRAAIFSALGYDSNTRGGLQLNDLMQLVYEYAVSTRCKQLLFLSSSSYCVVGTPKTDGVFGWRLRTAVVDLVIGRANATRDL